MLARRGVALALVATLLSTAALAVVAGPGYAADAVPWPASDGLVIGEVVTGGASASDEYVELYNAGPTQAELGGFELMYVTATGGTTTRKASFTAPLPLAPGAHLLLANSAGTYSPLADATYTGGFAADGGTLVLRTAGGAVIDTVGWGTAANSYVERAVAPAPPAGSSIERRPGGTAGNWIDTNDNSADWLVQSNPAPQSLSSPSTPRPTPTVLPTSPSPTPTMTELPTAGATPSDTATESIEPTPEPTAGQTAGPTSEPTATSAPTGLPTPSSEPTAAPTPVPTPAPSSEPTAAPTPVPTPAPSSEPTPPAVDPIPIASARLLPAGTRVHIAGAVTSPAGVLGSDDLIAVADSSGGIFVRVPASLDAASIGRSIDVIGTLSAPYGQLEVRELEWLQLGDAGESPLPAAVTPGEIGEQLEGSLVRVGGTIDSVTVDSGRLTIVLGDGQSSVRVLADPPTGLTKSDAVRGRRAVVTGIVGQHATAVGREDGYRIWLRNRTDLSVEAGSTSSPSASSPTSSGTPSPRPSATPTTVYRDLAHGLVKGRLVDVEAVVTAAAGVIDWGGPTVVIDDGTAAVAVVLPAGSSGARVGARVHVGGKVGSLHNGLRVVATLMEVRGDGPAPQPRQITRALGADLEWQLVGVCGRIVRVTRAGSRWRADLNVAGSTVPVLGEPGAGISPAGLIVGRLAVVAGIVRRSTSESGVFLLLPRSPQDITLGPAPATPPAPVGQAAHEGGSASGSGDSLASGPDTMLTPVSDLPEHEGQSVTVAGVVTEADGSTAMLDDGSGRVRLGGTAASDAISLLEVGDAIEVSGTVQRYDDGWTIDVDPERVLAFSGANLTMDASGGPSQNSPEPRSEGSGEAPDHGGQTRGLAQRAAGSSGLEPLVALFGGLLAAAGGLISLLFLVARRAGIGRRPFARNRGGLPKGA